MSNEKLINKIFILINVSLSIVFIFYQAEYIIFL